MLRIESLTAQAPEEHLEQVRDLFRAYGRFLKTSGGDALFCFSRLDEEIMTLPRAYTDANGEVLVAWTEDRAVGCVAYRRLNSERPGCVEVKRLFVAEVGRGQGIGRRLIEAALDSARARRYRVACLDTEPASMEAAGRLYRELGFEDDDERNAANKGEPVVFLKKTLVPG